MEATKEQASGLLHIPPPRLEDAGLEDCALPPDSIKEAFLKAATAVKSRATSIFTSDEDDCVKDPWPETLSAGPCSGDKGGAVGVGGDKVVVGGEEEKGDKVIVGGEDVREGGDRACVDGLEIGEEEEKKNARTGGGNEEDEEEKDGEGPILRRRYVSRNGKFSIQGNVDRLVS